MTLILHCDCCGVDFEYEVEKAQTLYGAVYIANARHERTNMAEGCMFAAARFVRLIGVKW